jgi:hypothetical protein
MIEFLISNEGCFEIAAMTLAILFLGAAFAVALAIDAGVEDREDRE